MTHRLSLSALAFVFAACGAADPEPTSGPLDQGSARPEEEASQDIDPNPPPETAKMVLGPVTSDPDELLVLGPEVDALGAPVELNVVEPPILCGTDPFQPYETLTFEGLALIDDDATLSQVLKCETQVRDGWRYLVHGEYTTPGTGFGGSFTGEDGTLHVVWLERRAPRKCGGKHPGIFKPALVVQIMVVPDDGAEVVLHRAWNGKPSPKCPGAGKKGKKKQPRPR